MLFLKPVVTRCATPNFEKGRGGSPVVGICFHIAEGTREGTRSWFADPASQVSSHYLVNRDGSIDQFVEDEDTAWTQGILNHPTWPLLGQYPYPNRVLIGIEHEGYSGQDWTPAMYAADLALTAHLCEAHDIRPERPFLLGHSELDSLNRPGCPGPTFPWERLLRHLQQLLQPGLPAWLPPAMLEAMRAGISDGSRSMEPANRAEALAMVMRAAGDRLAPATYLPLLTPPDVPSWLLPFIGQALEQCITDGTNLQQLARRIDVMTFVVRAVAAVRHPPQATPAPNSDWWRLDLYPALAQGHGISDGTRPGEICTRGEAMAMAVRLREQLTAG